MIMKIQKVITTMMFGLALALAGCGDKDAGKADSGKKADKADPEIASIDGGDAVEVPALDPKVEQAVNLANKISADPGSADVILDEAGLDRQAFERLLYEIARDPELSKSYAIAREV
jgi:hypothetical protein